MKNNIDKIDVAYVANLARLELSEAETGEYQAQLDQIVGYIRKMAELDLSEVEPTSHVVGLQNVFRSDEAGPGLDQESVLANAPARADDQFKVPRIME
jgi:aspartyl-tRNA(Asn)/glutamyl-tRNA(Gln) amidotransferase subunit C